MIRFVFLVAVLLAGCVAPSGLVGSVSAGYVLEDPIVTPGGVIFDGPSAAVPTVDRIIAEVAACLGRDLGTLRIKIAGDWVLNCDATEQVLPVIAGVGDPRKPENFALSCPARWRALYEPDGLIVSTPSMRNVKDPIMRLVTGEQDLWGNAKLAACAAPTTDPLQVW